MNQSVTNWSPTANDPASSTQNVTSLFSAYRQQKVRYGHPQNTITLQLQEGTIHLPFQDILYFQGERNYTHVVTRRNKRILIAKTLKEFEAMLNPQTFFRCHKSFLVNGIHIKKQKENNVIELSGNAEVVISRRKKTDFKYWFANLQSQIRARNLSFAAFGQY